MKNPEKVYSFLKADPGHPYCDDCLGKATGINRHAVNTITSTLALFPGAFVRDKGPCACSDQEKVRTTFIPPANQRNFETPATTLSTSAQGEAVREMLAFVEKDRVQLQGVTIRELIHDGHRL